jgi:hypothetical protein
MIVHAWTQKHRVLLLQYIAKRIGMTPEELVGDMPYHAIGFLRGEHLKAAAIYTNFRRHSIEAHICGEPGCITRGEIRDCFAYAFQHLDVLRIDGIVRRNNKRVRRVVEGLGFKVKRVADDEFGPGKDGIVYAMRRSECKWLEMSRGL